MKQLIWVLAYSLSFSVAGAVPRLFDGAVVFKVEEECPSLRLKKIPTKLALFAKYNTFELLAVPEGGNLKYLITLKVPDEASYFFKGPSGMQFANEVSSHETKEAEEESEPKDSRQFKVSFEPAKKLLKVKVFGSNGDVSTCSFPAEPFPSE